MLLVTTTMGMFDGVHRNTSDSGPVLLFGLCLVVGVVGLQQRLVSSLTAGDDANHSTAAARDGLAEAGGESDTGALAVFGVSDDDAGAAGRASDGTSISELGLDVGDNGAFGHGVHGHDVADGKSRYNN